MFFHGENYGSMNLCILPGKFKNYCGGSDMTALAILDLNFLVLIGF